MTTRPAQSEAMRRSWADPAVRLNRRLGGIRRRHERLIARMRANGTAADLIAAQEERFAYSLPQWRKRLEGRR